MSAGAGGVEFRLVARPAPELVERVCRVLRHRGATLVDLQLDASGPRSLLTARVGALGDAELLARQLRRLPDVDSVEVTAAQLA